MESSGNPPREGEPREDAAPSPRPWAAPEPAGGAAREPFAEDDAPLPSWYKPPGQRAGDASASGQGEPPGSPTGPPPPAPEPESPGASGGDDAPPEPPPPAAEPESPSASGAQEGPPEEPAPRLAPAAEPHPAAHHADEAPAWSRARELPWPDGAPATTPEAALPPTAVADAWTTNLDQPATPRWALHAGHDHPHVFGDRMAAGVLLTLAAASMTGGGIYALLASDLSATVRAIVCGVAAAVLLGGAVVLRLVRGTDDLRGTLAVTGIAFAAACLVFAYNPDQPGNRDNLIKFALAAGVVTVLSWFAAVVVPSAVAGLIGVVALATGVGAAIWLVVDQPTYVEVFVGAIGVGLAAALLLPRLALLRPHPGGLGWALGGATLVIAPPAIVLMATKDGVALAAGATASAALLALAQRHRNLPAAVGAFAGLAYLELLLVATRTGAASGGAPDTTELIIFVAVGVVLAVLVALAAVLQGRARPALPRRRRLPAGIAELLLVAALALSIISLFTANSGVQQLNPTQLQPGSGSTAVHQAAGGAPPNWARVSVPERPGRL